MTDSESKDGIGNRMKQFSDNFEERVEAFHLDRKLVNKTLTLGEPVVWDDNGAPFPVIIVSVRDIDVIKHLIGVPDKYFEDGLVTAAPQHREAASFTGVTPDNLKQIAHAYVFGDSRKLKQHKNDIENTMGDATLHIAAAETITIDDEMIVSGNESKSIVADTLIFKEKGQIVCEGVLTLNIGTLINQVT